MTTRSHKNSHMKHTKTPIWVLIVVIWIFRLSTYLLGQEFPEPPQRVKVNVTAHEDISGRIESYIKRELRSLQDVEVVQDNPTYEIFIIASEHVTESGHKMGGISFSILILSPIHVSSLLNTLKNLNIIYPRQIKLLEKWFGTPQPYKLHDFFGLIGSAEDLKGLCEQIVARFDSKCLEPWREIYQELKDEAEKSRQKEKK